MVNGRGRFTIISQTKISRTLNINPITPKA